MLIMILAVAALGRADTLRLRNGSTVRGTFLGGTGDEVRFSVDNEVRRYARADVAEINFDSLGDSAVDSPAPKIDPGPDFVGAPFLRGSAGYIPLEKEIAVMARGRGMYGIETVYRVQGARSPVRVRQGDRLVFVVRLNASGDPRQFQLFRLTPRMGYRQTQPTAGGPPPALPLTINKISDSVYELVPARALYPGEYAVSAMNSNESYCFGMD